MALLAPRPRRIEESQHTRHGWPRAEGDYLSAAKKLLDTRHPRFKAVSAVRNRAVSFFNGVSLPFPDPGIRLIRQEDIGSVDGRMSGFKEELDDTVNQLDDHFTELKTAASRRLGTLYSEADYPATLRGLFDMTWDFPSVEPPSYLQRLNPELYNQECQRVVARFDDAVQLAEQAFLDELSKLVGHLTERLTGQADGRPKVFRDSAVTNLTEFFERFRQLNIGSNEQLDELVNDAQQIVQGVEPQRLRDSQQVRRQVSDQLGAVQHALDDLLVDRPRRNILRRPR